ncbi:MAG: flagellar assembly protein FliX [Rhodospirillales bacterium]|nr:flagellar assembly protein FliX [Rhodospirillales bacterium]
MPILVTNAPRPAATASPRRKGAVRADGSRFTLESEAEAPPEAPGATTFVCPSALLLLQEAPGPEPAGGRAEAVRHGTGLLDRLDELRLALLCGAVPPARLRAIADALAARSARLGEPRLDAVIAEIELRCAVELAKFHRANRNGPSPVPGPEPVSRFSSGA